MKKKTIIRLIRNSMIKINYVGKNILFEPMLAEIAVHMDTTYHGQTTREILRNEAIRRDVYKNRLINPEYGEFIEL